jgi:hypothetical protein
MTTPPDHRRRWVPRRGRHCGFVRADDRLVVGRC